MARFTGTRGRDEFIGISGQDNRFVFLPGNLAGTDIVSGSTALTDIDTLVLYRPDGATGSVRAQAGKFDQVRNIEVVELADPGIELTVSQQLAGSSQRGFLTISGSSGNDVVSGQPTDPSRGPVTTALVFNANGGADSFTGGEGDDIFRFGDQDQSGTAIDGAGGSNIVRFIGAGSFDFATLADVRRFEGVELRASDGSATVILDDKPFATLDTGGFAVRSFGSDTIDASRVSAGNTVTAFLDDGDDTYFGGVGDEVVSGDAGNDTLTGGDGNDRLIGDDNADIGNDTLIGGNGDDYLSAGRGINVIDGGAGTDFAELDFSLFTGNLLFTLGSVAGEVYEATVDGLFAGSVTNVESVRISGSRGNNILTGGEGNDRLIDGVNGNDTLNGGNGDDSLTGTFGNDTLNGGNGNDFLSDGFGNNTLNGGDGDDYLSAGRGINVIDGGAGTDFAQFNFFVSGNVLFTAGSVAGVVYEATVDGVFAGSVTNVERVEIAGNGGNDMLTGGDGDDVLSGGEGNDTLTGGNGNDTLTGGGIFRSGDDFILTGDVGVDNLFGLDGNDRLLISDYDDGRLSGGPGDDTLELNGSNLTINLTTDTNKIDSIERLDLTGFGPNTLILNDRNVINATDTRDSAFTAAPTNDALVVLGHDLNIFGGDFGSILDLRTSSPGGSWAEVQSGVGLDGSAGGDFDFWAYTADGAVTAFLAVDSDVTVTTGGNNAEADAFVSALQAQEAANDDAPLELTQDLLLPAFFDVEEPAALYSPIHGDFAQPHIA
ncbi:MAG: calcium-binding protein [Sphingomonadales bacterium]|nr:MAG: calcium-binding protein [Sphingomonadales bacterium]